MAKLSKLAPRIETLRPRVDQAQGRVEVDRNRNRQPWRRWYGLARWKALRLDVFVRDMFTCQWPGCGRVEPDTSKLVADHRQRHLGDPALFWDERNLWTLCASCHSRWKQREEAAEGI